MTSFAGWVAILAGQFYDTGDRVQLGGVVGDYTAFARKTWVGMQERYLVEDAETAPMVSLVFNDNWIEFTVRYVVEYKKRRRTRDQLSRLILDEIASSDGRVALALATFHIVEAPPLNVRIQGGGTPAA